MTLSDYVSILATAFAGMTIAGGAYAAGSAVGYRRAKRERNSEQEENRFRQVYAPLYGLFTTCHVTTFTTRGAPYFCQRVRNARRVFREEGIIKSFGALFDRRDLGESAEVEYGGDFPLSGITKHLLGKEAMADQRLINLLMLANRSQYEERPSDGQLTNEDLRLFRHICREYEKLASRFAKT